MPVEFRFWAWLNLYINRWQDSSVLLKYWSQVRAYFEVGGCSNAFKEVGDLLLVLVVFFYDCVESLSQIDFSMVFYDAVGNKWCMREKYLGANFINDHKEVSA